MKNRLYFIVVTFLLSISIIGCSNDEEVAPPTKKTDDKKVEEKVKEVDPKVLLFSLMNHSPVSPIGDIPIPEDNPMKPEVIELGKTLFFDPRLSGNNEISCATCHDPNKGYGDDQPTLSLYNGGYGKRNSPTIINSGYYETNFWDGRANSLEEQALGPIQNPNEMNQTLNELIVELKGIKGYEERFKTAFGEGVTDKNIAKALAAFERLVVVNNTPYDRFLQGNTTALNQQELRGLSLFTGKAMCNICHNGQNLSDNKFYNIGINTDDEGRFAVTKDEKDLGRIRTPGLYGITHTAPYMRDGSIATLEGVIDYYDRGGDDHPNKSYFMDRFMGPIGLSKEEKADLLAFLKTLGGEPPIFTKPELPGLN
jgi:cytochrome c peroxidase